MSSSIDKSLILISNQQFLVMETDGLTSCNKNGGINTSKILGGARGVTVIVVGNGHGDTSSNPRRD